MNPNKQASISQQVADEPTRTTNYEGGMAFDPSDNLKLYLQSASWLVGEPKFYQDGDKVDSEIITLIQKVANGDAEFVLKLAVYLRDSLYLRTAPQILLVEAALSEGDMIPGLIRRATPKIVRRPDEMATVIAYLKSRIGNLGNHSATGSVPSGLKKGLADCFLDFTEYSLQKYNNQSRTVKLKDVIRLVHPKPKDKAQSEMFKRLIDGNLATPNTWETIISAEGSNPEAWTKAAKVMPYMATLRNLRNLMANLNEDRMKETIKGIMDTDAVARSKQFPFRFFSAYREIEKAEDPTWMKTDVLHGLSIALNRSVGNIPKIPGRSFIAADNSGSMTWSKVSERSNVQPRDIANLFLMMADKICEKSKLGVFASSLQSVQGSPDNVLDGLANFNKINFNIGYGTNGQSVLDYLIESNTFTDRIIIFSDMQMHSNDSWLSEDGFYTKFLHYKRTVNPKVIAYCFDLTGYGTLQIPENEPNIVNIGGFSDKIFRFFEMFESDKTLALQHIQSIEL